jgi:AraC-like DNA-binding protein
MAVSALYRSPVHVIQATGAPAAPVAHLGSVDVVTLSLEKSQAVEQLGDLAYARADKFVLILVETGAIAATLRGRDCRLQEGQCALFDCSAAVSFSGAGNYKILAIFIPSFLLQARLRNIPMILAQPLACTGSPWRIASNLVRTLANEVKHIPVPMAYGYANQVVELVSVAVEAGAQISSEFNGRSAIFRRCAAYMKSHLADCSLGPNEIAEAMGISVRYLHKVFRASGESVCDYLRLTRLETSKLELADPRKASLQIREIAHRVGFRSQAHFAATFKSRYGVSATEWRRAAMQALAADALRSAMPADAA